MSEEKMRDEPILPLCVPYVKRDECPAWQTGCNILVGSGTLSSSKSPKGLDSQRTCTRRIYDVEQRVYHWRGCYP